MGTWFKHPPSGIDTAREAHECQARNIEAWALLISRLTSAILEPDATTDDAVEGTRKLRFFRSKNEAMVYSVTSNPGEVQVLIVGAVRHAADEGQLIQEALNRIALKGEHDS